MKKIRFYFILSAFCFFLSSHASGDKMVLEKVKLDPTDFASLQRGAKTFINNCSGCHSLQYTRYESLAKGIGITNEQGEVLENVVKDSMMFSGGKLTSPILSSLDSEDAAKWFGTAPPDLSLVTKSRGADWVYNFLRSFYKDDNRPWGVNNTVFPDTAMPHVLLNAQGVQEPVYETVTKIVNGEEVNEKIIKSLSLRHAEGCMCMNEYDSMVTDLVNFLSFVADPHQVERKNIGVFVMAFLVIFTVFAYLLKREYWKDVH